MIVWSHSSGEEMFSFTRAMGFGFSVLLLTSLAIGFLSTDECCASSCWSVSTSVTQAAGGSLGISYYAVGSELRAVWSETISGHIAGEVAWTWSTPSGAAITNFPNPTPETAASPAAVYLGAEDGFLYKINAASGNVHWQKDLRRAGFPDDQVIGTPAVQLASLSNAAFQSAWGGNDAVFILTRYAGTHSENRVYGCFSNNGNPKWIFNSPPTVPMDFGVDGCAIDYSTNTLYCGTELAAASGPTVFAIDTLTKALKWSSNSGAIASRPYFVESSEFGNRLYVVTAAGVIRKLNPATGAMVWDAPLQIESRLAVWQELTGGAVAILAVDQTGFIHGIRDLGSNTEQIFLPIQSNGIPFLTGPVVFPFSGKAYLGRNDGQIAQVCIQNGDTEGVQPFVGSSTINDPTLDTSFGGIDPDRLLVTGSDASGLQVAQFCLPFVPTTCGIITGAPMIGKSLSFSLRPISPNPASGSTSISYDIAQDSNVEISVFDLGGRLVRTLVREQQATGSHAIEWDAKNDQGELVANGVYLVKLNAGADRFEEIQKIVLMR
jgi:outer membrane protein assembly factor BamB